MVTFLSSVNAKPSPTTSQLGLLQGQRWSRPVRQDASGYVDGDPVSKTIERCETLVLCGRSFYVEILISFM
jgi:hypothetical protein